MHSFLRNQKRCQEPLCTALDEPFRQRFLTPFLQLWQLVTLGALLGLGALVRSVLWLFPPFLVVYLFWATRDQRWGRRLLYAAIAVGAFMATIAPWSVRNTRLQKTFTTIDVMGGRNVMMGNYEYTPRKRIWAAIEIQGDEAWHRVLARENANYSELTQGQRDKLAMRRGLSFALSHPILSAQRCAIKFVNFWQLERTLVAGAQRGWWRTSPKIGMLAVAAVVFPSYAATMLLGIFGMVTQPPADRRMHCFLLLLVGFVWAVHTAVFAHSRYHLSLMPLVMIYAAAALVHARDIWGRRPAVWFRVATALCVMLAASWVWEIVFVELPQLRGELNEQEITETTEKKFFSPSVSSCSNYAPAHSFQPAS